MTSQQTQNYLHALGDFTRYLSELRAGCDDKRREFIRQEAVTCDALMVHSDLPKLRRVVDDVFAACHHQ
mgnify:CR=1 FL=1